jgi:hypothetical protein
MLLDDEFKAALDPLGTELVKRVEDFHYPVALETLKRARAGAV